jgi:hypothetical protein
MVVHLELRARPWAIPCIAEDDGDGSRWANAKHERFLALERRDQGDATPSAGDGSMKHSQPLGVSRPISPSCRRC